MWVNALDAAGNTSTEGPFKIAMVQVLVEGGDNGFAYVNVTTTLTATVLGAGGYTYSWDFGDGTVLTDTDPVVQHPYESTGIYTATVTATLGVKVFTGTTQITVVEQRAKLTPRIYVPLITKGYIGQATQIYLPLVVKEYGEAAPPPSPEYKLYLPVMFKQW